MSDITQQINAIAASEGVLALVEKYGLDKEEAINTFTLAVDAVVVKAAEGMGVCLRADCKERTDGGSTLLCLTHLVEV